MFYKEPIYNTHSGREWLKEMIQRDKSVYIFERIFNVHT